MDDQVAAALLAARRIPGLHEKYQRIADIVIEDMQETGQFVHVSERQAYFLPHSTAKPHYISKRSDAIDAYLTNEYELNSAETEHEFVMNAISAMAIGMDINGTENSLSAYNEEEEALYLHTGAGELLQITADHVNKVPNGTENMVFHWNDGGDTFDPALNGHSTRKWWEYLFHDAILTVQDIEPEQATAILTAWFMFLLFRNLATSRPILAALGDPGAGKTVLFKRIYLMLYGNSRSIQAIHRPDDFDYAVANSPFVAFDNIDISVRWLPDRLAQVSSVTDIEKRQLYQDRATILLRRHALVGITSHNPEFTRADVADRLLIFTLKRWDHHAPEGVIMSKLAEARDRLWGGVVGSIQAALATPRPRPEDAPQMRIQDFAYLGLWFATAVGMRDAFLTGLNKLMLMQRTFALTEEQLLIECLEKGVTATGFVTAGELWKILTSVTNDGGMEFRYQYKNPATLARRLVALSHPLRDFYRVERKRDHKHGYLWDVRKV